MELRIVSGEFKNRRIVVPADLAAYLRPTGQRVRDALAQVVGERCVAARVGDFCAGSGAWGFEMLSRGAAAVDFVEQNSRLAAAIRENARRLNVAGRCTVFSGDLVAYVDKCDVKYDVLYCDPPYERTDIYAAVGAMSALLAHDGVLLVERRRQKDQAAGIRLEIAGMRHQERAYGDTIVDIYWRA